MPVVGDYLRFKDFQSLTNIAGDILNVYYFEVLAITTPTALSLIADDVGVSWFEDFLTNILVIQSNTLTHTRLEVDNVTNFEGDFMVYTPDFPVAGTNLGPYLASSTAWSFQLTRSTRATRHGSKRIAGVPESAVDNNQAAAGILSALSSVETRLRAEYQIEYNSGADLMTLAPVIAKTPVAPATLPTVFNPVSGAVYRGVGSQNSRKQLLS